MSSRHRVAVVGLGYFSQFHLSAWQTHPGAELVAATDRDPDRRDWATATYGIPVQDSLEAVLAQNPDIIDIVAPPPAHGEIIGAALARGRVLICQKPFCTSPKEAIAVTQAAQAAGTRLIIHENFRFQPWYRSIKQVLESGRMGAVYQAQFFLRPGDGRGADAYRARQPAFRTMPRLLIHETGVHFIDLFRWLFGDITAVYADLRRLNPCLVGEDAGMLILDHVGGARAVFDGNRLGDHVTDAPRRTMGEMRMEGEGGTLTLDGTGAVTFRRFGAQQGEAIPLAYTPDDTFGGGCVAALNSHVIEAMAGRVPFENEARDYLPVMAASELAYASAEQGRKLYLKGET